MKIGIAKVLDDVIRYSNFRNKVCFVLQLVETTNMEARNRGKETVWQDIAYFPGSKTHPSLEDAALGERFDACSCPP
jgi:hypothetical protein